MRSSSPVLALSIFTIFCLLVAPATALLAEQPDAKPESVLAEEYPIYDLVIQDKFLTSQTQLVLIERLTVTRLGPDWPPTNQALFDEQQFFDGSLPPGLVQDFVMKNSRPSRLEAQFNFGVRYRFISGQGQGEEPEVSLSPVPAALALGNLAQAVPTTIGILGFSRVGFTVKRDQALVYVGDNRPDGTGAGFLLWLSRQGQAWEIADTEVLWIARPEEGR